MKTSTNQNVLLRSFDLELKALLQKDLQRMKMMQENKAVAVKAAA